MSLTFVQRPSEDELFPTQANCKSICYKLTSDLYLQSVGVNAITSVAVNANPSDGDFLIVEGVKATFRAAGGTLVPGEVEIGANISATAANLAAYYIDNLLGYSIVPFGNLVPFVKLALYLLPGQQTTVPVNIDQAPTLGLGTPVIGQPYQPLPNYAVDFRVTMDGEPLPIYQGRVTPRVTKDFDLNTISHEILVDVSSIPRLYEDLHTRITGLTSNNYTTMVVEFAEVVGGARGPFISAPPVRLLHASAPCGQTDYTEYDPDAGNLYKFLYVPGGEDARILYPSDSLLLYCLAESGTYQIEVDGTDAGEPDLTVSTGFSGIRVDMSAAVQGLTGPFGLTLEGLTNANTVGPLDFSRRATNGAEGCNYTQILFLNSLGGYQYFGITTLRSAGIEVAVTEYVNCTTCGGASKARTAAKTAVLRETYYTRPLRVSEANVRLLEDFLSSGAYYDMDGNQVILSVEDYAIEGPNRRIQIPVTFQRLEVAQGLIDPLYNKS